VAEGKGGLRGNGSCGDSILVADGDADCRALLSETFARVGFSTREASTGFEALEIAESSRASLVLLDVELPGMSGYEVCRELRSRHGESLPLVLLSGTRIEALDRIAGLLIGADDYIVKPFDPGELLARARLLLRRNGAGHEHHNEHSPNLDSLTPREHEVLDLLAEGRGQDEIAGELFITPKTVATHIQRILSKLGVHSRAQAVAVALRNRIGEPEEDFVAHVHEPTFEPV
jgi:DNA-binding NarL/FixJ family response regulator